MKLKYYFVFVLFGLENIKLRINKKQWKNTEIFYLLAVLLLFQ